MGRDSGWIEIFATPTDNKELEKEKKHRDKVLGCDVSINKVVVHPRGTFQSLVILLEELILM